MGARGFVGFVVDGVEKISYSHSHSNPGALGLPVLDWLRQTVAGGDTGRVTELARALRVVRHTSYPTAEDIAHLSAHTNLLHHTGDPAAMLQIGVIEDGSQFPAYSQFAAWGYVVDLDAKRFEVYEGYQCSPHGKGRFAHQQGCDGYAPVALIASWPLAQLPSSEAFVAHFEARVAAARMTPGGVDAA